MADLPSAGRAEPIPAALWTIALLALAPFPVTAIAFAYGPKAWVRPALTTLIAWSAVVLSFLGGVRWGLETREPQPRWQRQAFSALSAAAALVVLLARGRMPDTWIMGGFITAFLIQWLFDHQTANTPARYPLLSTAVTGAACVSLAMALGKALHV